MKRRLRKKLGLGEFQGFVFEVKFQFDPRLDSEVLMGEWIEVVEANRLWCGGGGEDGEWEFAISFDDAVAPKDRGMRREAIEHWLENHERIKGFEVGPIKADLIGAYSHSKRAAQNQAKRNARLGIEFILDF